MSAAPLAAATFASAALLLAWPHSQPLAAAAGRDAHRGAQRCRQLLRPIRRAAAGREAEQMAMVELAERLAALARAGVPAVQSWRLLADDQRSIGRDFAWQVAGILSAGGAIDEGLAAASARLQSPLARRTASWLAAVFEMSERTGAPIGRVLDAFATAVRDRLAAERQIASQLAGPRATARVLAAMPAISLAAAHAMGARPLIVLGEQPAGRLLAVVAVLLWLVGHWWSRRLLAGAVRAARQ